MYGGETGKVVLVLGLGSDDGEVCCKMRFDVRLTGVTGKSACIG